MNFDEYQKQARSTAIYPKEFSILYPALGLAGESGEVCEKVKKLIRDTNMEMEDYINGTIDNSANNPDNNEIVTDLRNRKKEIKKEIGDVLWYCANLAADFSLSLNEIAQQNIEKLFSRKERGKLQGSGDNR